MSLIPNPPRKRKPSTGRKATRMPRSIHSPDAGRERQTIMRKIRALTKARVICGQPYSGLGELYEWLQKRNKRNP